MKTPIGYTVGEPMKPIKARQKAPIEFNRKPIAQMPALEKKKEVVSNLPDATSTQILNLTNAYRVSNHLLPLKYNFVLSKSAQKRADYIAQNQDQWSHDGWIQEIQSAGYKGALNPAGQIRGGENLARNFIDIPSAFTGWKQSPTHNANLININYRDIGIGYATYKDNKGRLQTVFVQHFGVPKQ